MSSVSSKAKNTSSPSKSARSSRKRPPGPDRPEPPRVAEGPSQAAILRQKLTQAEAEKLAYDSFGDMFKLVVDVEREVLTVGGSMHYEGETLLLQNGSSQENVWGANYYPKNPVGDRLEYEALINIRSWQDNPSYKILSEQRRIKVKKSVERWIGPA